MKNLLCLLLLCCAGGCKIPDKGIIDTTAPPFISQATMSPSVINVNRLGSLPTDPIDTTIGLSAVVQDTTSSPLVIYTLLDPSGNVFSTGNLAGNGGGKFSTSSHFHILKQDVGTYSVQFQATSNGEVSNTVVQSVVVENSNNHPPIVSNLMMPDTVSIPPAGDTTFVKITIAASDSDGLADIVSVTLTSKKPDGTSAGVFYLYDDGNQVVNTQFGLPFTSGDSVANDGIYTIVIPLTKVTDVLPTYRDFSFEATDRTGAFSNIITKRIFIIQ
ncbi:MAG: hypothetical protein WBW71_02220 [Bacteroidota bacterium]